MFYSILLSYPHSLLNPLIHRCLSYEGKYDGSMRVTFALIPRWIICRPVVL